MWMAEENNLKIQQILISSSRNQKRKTDRKIERFLRKKKEKSGGDKMIEWKRAG